jgi:hypothetical protein
VQAWALVQAGDPEAIDVFLTRVEAEDALVDWSPSGAMLLRVEEIALAGVVVSPN